MKAFWTRDGEAWKLAGDGWRIDVYPSGLQFLALAAWDSPNGAVKISGSFPFSSTRATSIEAALETARAFAETVAGSIEGGMRASQVDKSPL
jgi:hypothetical protein